MTNCCRSRVFYCITHTAYLKLVTFNAPPFSFIFFLYGTYYLVMLLNAVVISLMVNNFGYGGPGKYYFLLFFYLFGECRIYMVLHMPIYVCMQDLINFSMVIQKHQRKHAMQLDKELRHCWNPWFYNKAVKFYCRQPKSWK